MKNVVDFCANMRMNLAETLNLRKAKILFKKLADEFRALYQSRRPIPFFSWKNFFHDR